MGDREKGERGTVRRERGRERERKERKREKERKIRGERERRMLDRGHGIHYTFDFWVIKGLRHVGQELL